MEVVSTDVGNKGAGTSGANKAKSSMQTLVVLFDRVVDSALKDAGPANQEFELSDDAVSTASQAISFLSLNRRKRGRPPTTAKYVAWAKAKKHATEARRKALILSAATKVYKWVSENKKKGTLQQVLKHLG